LVLALAAPGCTEKSPSVVNTDAPVEVVTTVYPLADIIKELGGEKVIVSHLLPPGASPHTYEPTVRQAKLAHDARLFVYIGAGLDNWAVKISEAAGSGQLFLDLSEHVDLAGFTVYYDEENGAHNHQHTGSDQVCHHDHGPVDPHYWLDPLLVRDLLSPAITEQLIYLIPHSETYFYDNLNNYQQELTLLHEEILESVNNFSRDQFISFHSAWQHFSRRYQLHEVAVIAEFPGQEPSAGWLAELAGLIEKENIAAIFIEPQFPGTLAESIAAETGIKIFMLDPLGDETRAGRETYLNLMRYNSGVFKEALQ